jgi:hypothetical protein
MDRRPLEQELFALADLVFRSEFLWRGGNSWQSAEVTLRAIDPLQTLVLMADRVND